jgi:hypothetical protein
MGASLFQLYPPFFYEVWNLQVRRGCRGAMAVCDISTIVVGNAWATREDEIVSCLLPTAKRLVLVGDCSHLGLPRHRLVAVRQCLSRRSVASACTQLMLTDSSGFVCLILPSMRCPCCPSPTRSAAPLDLLISVRHGIPLKKGNCRGSAGLERGSHTLCTDPRL